MFIKNTQKEPIGPITCQGYSFTIPPGVSNIWDSAGELALKLLGVMPNTEPDPKKKPPLPPIMQAKEDDWKGQYCTVERFKINAANIRDRKYAIQLARERGVDKDKVQSFIDDEGIETDDILKTLNALPVPDEVRMPVQMADTPPTT